MNILALATRGYLSPVSIMDCGSAPVIKSMDSEKPDVILVVTKTTSGPNISGSKIDSPSIGGSSSKKGSGISPSFKGGKTSKPSIKK